MPNVQIILNIVSDEENEKVLKSYDPETGSFTYTPIFQIENLDVPSNTSINFTFEVNDVRNIIDKKGSYSQTVKLPDTTNNRKIFSAISELNAEGSFNPKRKTKCFVMADSVLIFEGILQLIMYNVVNMNYCEYEVLLSSNIKGFKDSLGDRMLHELPWGSIEAYWTAAGVQETWNENIVSELFYPLIDYGWNFKDVNLANWSSSYGYLPHRNGPGLYTENFYPGIYLRSYIARIFAVSGFKYQSNFFKSDNFNKMFIPYSGTDVMSKYDINYDKTGSYAANKYFKAYRNNNYTLTPNVSANPLTSYEGNLVFNFSDDPGLNWSTMDSTYENNSPINEVFKQRFVMGLEMTLYDFATGLFIDVENDADIEKIEVFMYRSFSTEIDTTAGSEWTAGRGRKVQKFTLKNLTGDGDPVTAPTYGFVEAGVLGFFVNLNFDYLTNISYAGSYVDTPDTAPIFGNTAAIRPNEKFRFNVRVTTTNTNIIYQQRQPSFVRNDIALEVIYGSKIDIGNIVAKNIKCVDFMRTIINLFNLYIEPSKEDPTLLLIEPRDDYYASGDKIDWSDKIDLNQDINVNVISEITPRYTKFTFKDSEDYANKLYKTSTNYTYGEYTYDNFNEFVTNEETNEVMFVPTINTLIPNSLATIIPNLSTDYGLPTAYVYPTKPGLKFNAQGLRLLYAKKRQKLQPDPLPSLERFRYMYFGLPYNPTSFGGLLGIVPFYPYAGSLDDLYFPTHDLNYGVPQALAYEVTPSNQLSYTQYNLIQDYWIRNLDEVSNRGSRLITCSMFLTAGDIRNLSFADQVYLRINHPKVGLNQGTYFRINKITGYNPSISGTCKVELVKADYVFKNPGEPVIPGTSTGGGTIGGGDIGGEDG